MKDDWTAPGAFAVAQGVYRIPLPLPNDGLRAVNVFAIVQPDGVVMVDAGWAVLESQEAFERAIATLDLGLGDIRRFLVTHIHRDHFTQAVSIRRRFGTPISLGSGERASLQMAQEPSRRPNDAQIGQLASFGAVKLARDLEAARRPPALPHTIWEDPDEWLTPGQLTLGDLRLDVVETPGHTRGHVVFFDRAARLLFAGDHVLPRITPSIGFEPALSPDPLGSYLRSLAMVRSLPDATLLPAHGPVTESVHQRVDELVEHHGRRLDQVARAVERGADTVMDVARCLKWTRRERPLAELDPFNQLLALGETHAHLILLVAQGRVAEGEEDGLLRFWVPE